ncbi:hypothetical protein VNI00_011535 [Paramarasmius palmivorus]|uniref:Uncharacterized protein n=1 Tax=Paramarasmius palmivorus TaxID=297713 RepID=A0AAW0CCD2_9AGAR
MTTPRVWYLLVDHKNQPIGRPSKVSSLGIEYVVDLKEKVKENAAVTLKDVAASQLEVWRCTNQEIRFVGKDIRAHVQEVFSKDQVVYLNEQQEIAELRIKAKEILLIRVQALLQKLLNDNSLNNYWPYRMHKLFWGKNYLLSQAEWEARPLDWLKSTNWHLYRLSYYEKLEERIKTIKHAGKEGVVILGNPGAGKSSFLEYLYIRSLCNKEDVVYFFDGIIAIHTEEKCYVTNSKSLPLGFFEVDFNGVTLLIEWNRLADPPAALVRKGVRLFAVQATSPREERYRWIEQRLSVEVVVDLPSNEDFYKILPTHTRANVDAAIAKWGRDIRKIQKALTDGEGSLENTVKTALDRMTLDDLHILSKNPSASPLCFSHGLIATAAQTLDRSCPTDSDIMVHFITSPYICRTFLQAIVLIKKVKLEEFFFMLRCDTSLGATRGIVFENLAHEAIINRGKFEVRPVDLRSGHVVESGSKFNSLTNLLRESDLSPSLYSQHTRVAETRSPSCYYIPTESNNPTFDSFMVSHNNRCIAFQMTVGRNHTLKEKGLNILMKRFGKVVGGGKHQFVFVVPQGSEFRFPPLPGGSWDQEFEFYILQLSVGNDFLGYTRIDRPCDGDPELPPGEIQDIGIEMGSEA